MQFIKELRNSSKRLLNNIEINNPFTKSNSKFPYGYANSTDSANHRNDLRQPSEYSVKYFAKNIPLFSTHLQLGCQIVERNDHIPKPLSRHLWKCFVPGIFNNPETISNSAKNILKTIQHDSTASVIGIIIVIEFLRLRH